jgi:glucose/arabinose dehydrogenase
VTGVPAVLYLAHGGLLDVAVDPDFNSNGIVYLSYLQGNEKESTMRVMKARFDGQSETLVDGQVIFESNPAPKHDQIGGRLALAGDGYLFLSLGDLWEGERAQNLKDLRGSIVRIAPTDRSPMTIRLRSAPTRGPKSGATAIGIRKAWLTTVSPACSGHTSTAPKAGTRSI